MTDKDERQRVLVDNWSSNYVQDNLCSLCGGIGLIDTRATAVTPAGFFCGRVNFCMCPNGMSLRVRNEIIGVDPERVLAEYKTRTNRGLQR